jgi:hypothetical protein
MQVATIALDLAKNVLQVHIWQAVLICQSQFSHAAPQAI